MRPQLPNGQSEDAFSGFGAGKYRFLQSPPAGMHAQRKAVRGTPGQGFTLCPAGHR